MENIKKGSEKCEIPTQEFDGKVYYLYPNEKYFSKGNKRLHRVVWEFYNGKIPKGYDIHHVDNNTNNNDISNLNLVSRSLHAKFTGKQRFKDNPEKMRATMEHARQYASEWHSSEEGRKWHSKQAKECYAKREFVKKKCAECGKEFETRDPKKAKYCHNNCKAKANRRMRKEKYGKTDKQRAKERGK